MFQSGGFLLILCVLLRTEGLEFSLKKELSSTKNVLPELWSQVQIDYEKEFGNYINVLVKIPLSVKTNYSGISVFFANDNRNILRLDFEDKLVGIFYTHPYKIQKIIKISQEVEKSSNNGVIRVSARLDPDWLPEKCSRVNAAVVADDGRIFNFYGLKNLGISIKDLLIVEEYNTGSCF